MTKKKAQALPAAVEKAIAELTKTYGEGTVMFGGDPAAQVVDVIPTGSLSLDLAIGVGGVPRGRVTEVFGPESVGKSMLCLHLVAEAQKLGLQCSYVDMEHALDQAFAAKIGVDLARLMISQPDTGEQALEIVDALVQTREVGLIVVDSVAALVPRAEIEGEMGDAPMAMQARLMSQALRKLSGSIKRANAAVVFVNQLRQKIGVIFGSPEVTSGGMALKFYASVRLDIRRIQAIKNGSEVVGARTRVRVVKNKCITGQTTVFDPHSGLTSLIGENTPATAVSQSQRGELSLQSVTRRLDNGTRPCLRLILANTTLDATPDHQVLTDGGWCSLGTINPGDLIARPRLLVLPPAEPQLDLDMVRMIGYLIGNGYVGGKTQITLVTPFLALQYDARRIAENHGCDSRIRKIEVSFSHRLGVKNQILDVLQQIGLWGKLAPDKTIPSALWKQLGNDLVFSELLFGLIETDGTVHLDKTGGIRCGYSTTSFQLAHQVHWMLLSRGITSSILSRPPKPGGVIAGRRISARLDSYEVRISGWQNNRRLSHYLRHGFGPRSSILASALQVRASHRLSESDYLSPDDSQTIVELIRRRWTLAQLNAILEEDAPSIQHLLGHKKLQRPKVERLVPLMNSDQQVVTAILDNGVWYDPVIGISAKKELEPVYDLEMPEDHNFVANDILVHNCAPPFREAEFDIIYNEGISKWGDLMDLGVQHGVIEKRGAFFSYNDQRLGQGREHAIEYLRANTEVAAAIETQVREKTSRGSISTEQPVDQTGSED